LQLKKATKVRKEEDYGMEAVANRGAFRESAYAMKKHLATRLHYDLRLEWNRVLLSWALPEGPDCRAGITREAIEMDDHRLAYLQFEGVHETGPIMLWDRGTWEPYSGYEDIGKSLCKGILQFKLYGDKLGGSWILRRTYTIRNARPIWMLCKQADEFAESYTHSCVLVERPNSISTGRTLEEIVRDWTRPKDKHPGQMKLFE
jgi:bifunctional non-homologous end joining protein LigD